MAELSDSTPHLTFPFRFGEFQEEDSFGEVAQNMRVILSYELGERDDLPEFGITDPSFREGGADLAELAAAIERWEPRASAVIEADPWVLESMVQEIQVRLENADA